MYSEKVMDHFSNPRNVGQIDNANAVGEVGNAKCGDIMKIYMDIQDDVIKDVKFKTFGCGAAIATSSMATEMVKGKTVDEALALTNKAVMEALDGLPKEKIHCSVLAEEAIQSAINEQTKHYCFVCFCVYNHKKMMIYGYNMVLVAGVKQTTQHNILYLLGNYEHIGAIYLNILYNVYVYLQENIAKLLTIVYNH